MMTNTSTLPAIFLAFAGLAGLIGVATGAVASHANLPAEDLKRIGTASDYLIWHALALLGAVLLRGQMPDSKLPLVTGALFILGMLLFAGNLLAIGFIGWNSLSGLTPVGGICLMAGWLSFAFCGLKLKAQRVR